MRRLLRLASNFAVVTSLILLLATLLLWARSFGVVDFWTLRSGDAVGHIYQFDLVTAGISFEKSRWESVALAPRRWDHWSCHRGEQINLPTRMGTPEEVGFFDAGSLPHFSASFRPVSSFNQDGHLITAHLPFWTIALATALLPAVRVGRIVPAPPPGRTLADGPLPHLRLRLAGFARALSRVRGGDRGR